MFFDKIADGLKLALNKTALRLHTKMKTTEAVRLTKLKHTHTRVHTTMQSFSSVKRLHKSNVNQAA